MKTKLIIALLLLTLLPVGLAIGFGQNWLTSSQSNYQNQFKQLVSDKLINHETTLQQVFENYREQLLADTEELRAQAASSPRETVAEARKLSRLHPLLRQVAWLDKEGELFFPNQRLDLSAGESAFLERSNHLWQSGEFFQSLKSLANDDTSLLPSPTPSTRVLYQAQRKPHAEMAAEASYAPSADTSTTNDLNPPKTGWYSYYAGSTLRHIFYIHSPQNTFALELNSARLKAALIATLPSSAGIEALAKNSSNANFRIQLLDSQNRVIYQWGNFVIDNGSPLLNYSLAAPLGSWKMVYYGEGTQSVSKTQTTFLWSFTALLFNILAGLSWYLYREHQRELRLSEQRVSFVNQISHELKTPLTNVRMYAELAQQDLAESGDTEQATSLGYLKIITEESERLSRLINNVLSFSRQQKQSNTLYPTEQQPDSIIQSVLETFRPSLASKNVICETNLQASSPLFIDSDTLEQVLINLISNVEKYAAYGGKLEVNSLISDNTLELRVRDYGDGIAKDQQSKIFEAFYRSSNKLTEGVSGSGIGLNLARSLCRQHGGDLYYQGAKPGAEFIASFRSQEIIS